MAGLARAVDPLGYVKPGFLFRCYSQAGFASRGQRLRNRLGVLRIPAFEAAEVAKRWGDMGLSGRRSVLAAGFERIAVHPATTTRYDPDRIEVIWRTPRGATASG